MNTRAYWANREQSRLKAIEHTEEMASKYADEIQQVIDNSIVYGKTARVPAMFTGDPDDEYKNQDVVCMSTSTALFNAEDMKMGKVALLNFASYKNPGGMFLDGSCAQEESLCHDSYLYNVLKEFPEYYEENKKNLNRGLYKDRAIYSKNVRFEYGSSTRFADVITCAAPNRSVMLKYGGFSETDNYIALKERAEFIKNIVCEHDCDSVILGAWGCGVFKQDPKMVAYVLMDAFKTSGKRVIYAILDFQTYRVFNTALYELREGLVK